MRKFTEILEEYLEVRDQLNSDYYDNKFTGYRTNARGYMKDLANELDSLIEKVTNE